MACPVCDGKGFTEVNPGMGNLRCPHCRKGEDICECGAYRNNRIHRSDEIETHKFRLLERAPVYQPGKD